MTDPKTLLELIKFALGVNTPLSLLGLVMLLFVIYRTTEKKEQATAETPAAPPKTKKDRVSASRLSIIILIILGAIALSGTVGLSGVARLKKQFFAPPDHLILVDIVRGPL